jgi:hypothetical protein
MSKQEKMQEPPFIYATSEGRRYYLHGGQLFPDGRRLYYFTMWHGDALPSLPAGYVILERIEDPPALVSERHIQKEPECRWERILDLAERCDHQFYMSVIGGHKEARLARIREMVEELEHLSNEVLCPECQLELKWQLQLQKGVLE